jgi:hypothetical protein
MWVAVLPGCPELPDKGTKILFVKEICCDPISGAGGFVIAYRTRESTQEAYLTPETEHAGSPRWFADGERILYSANGAVMVMDEDGANKEEILNKGNVGMVRLSIDEERIFFLSGSDVISVDVDGGDEKVIATNAYDTTLEVVPVSGRVLFSRLVDEPHPTRTGTNLVVTRTYSVKPDGTDEIELGGDFANVIRVADISPDGKLATVFMQLEAPDDWNYPNWPGLIHLDNSKDPLIRAQLGEFDLPHFTPDGTRMIFALEGKLISCDTQFGDEKTILDNWEAKPSNPWVDPEDSERVWFSVESLPALGFTQYASGSASIRLDGTDLKREIASLPDRAALQP